MTSGGHAAHPEADIEVAAVADMGSSRRTEPLRSNSTFDEPGRSSGLFWLDRRPRSTVHLPRTRPEPGEAQRLWSWATERVG